MNRAASTTRRARGYVLLMVLLLLPIAATVMAVAGRRSLNQSMAATHAEADLRQRWLHRSAQRALLPRAEQLLRDAEQQSTRPVPAVQFHLTLPGHPEAMLSQQDDDDTLRVLVIVSDEQCKVNANALARRHGRQHAQRALQTLLAGAGSRQTVHLRPRQPKSRQDLVLEPYDTLSQVAADLPWWQWLPQGETQSHGSTYTPYWDDHPRHEAGRLSGGVGMHQLLTCWGDGKVNFRRAPESVLTAACQPLLSSHEAARILELRRQRPNLTLAEVADELEWRQSKQQAVSERLTDQSRSWSVWVVVQSSRRSWPALYVAPSGDARPGDARRFIW